MTPKLNDKIQTRLRAVALGVGGVHLLSLALDPVNHLLGFLPPSHLLEKNIISGSLILISLLVYIVNRHGSAESRFAKHAATFASAYHIIVAAGIELSAQLTPWPAPEAFPYPAMRLVSWVALWIVIYPLFVPLCPRRAALTALAAATMGPWTLALTLLLGNTWPGLGVAVFVHMPSFVAAALAAISARIVYGLETRASSTRLLGNYVLKERIAQVQDEPAPPSTFAPLPHDLETIILRCLRKDPADRPANARSLSASLAACEAATAWTAADAETFWTPWRKRSRDPSTREGSNDLRRRLNSGRDDSDREHADAGVAGGSH